VSEAETPPESEEDGETEMVRDADPVCVAEVPVEGRGKPAGQLMRRTLLSPGDVTKRLRPDVWL